MRLAPLIFVCTLLLAMPAAAQILGTLPVAEAPIPGGSTLNQPRAADLSQTRAATIPTLTPPAGVAGVLAAQNPATPSQPAQAQKDQPLFVVADKILQDDKAQTITLLGNVEIAQNTSGSNARVIKADKITYYQTTKKVIATGNVALMETTGDTVFAEELELTDDLQTGLINEMGMLLADNSRLAARVGERRGGRYMDLAEAVYSPCNLCEKDPSQAPLWQLKARRVFHDNQEKQVTYENAWLEFMGVPFLYTPYLSHPDPSVKRRSGFLTPGVGWGTNVGDYVETPYYFDIAPNKDFTLTPTFSTADTLQLAGEFRQRFQNGALRIQASGTQADRTEEDGSIQQNQARGHINANARFDVNDYWSTGGELFLSSDKTYLDRYRIAAPDILINRGFIEGFDKRDYAAAEMYYFQDTRPGSRPAEPYVIPRLRAETTSAPNTTPLGGRYSLNGEMLSLERPGRSTDTRRLSAAGNWQRLDYLPIGLVSTVNADLRADNYIAENVTNPRTGFTKEQATDTRLFPSASAQLSLPVAKQYNTVQHTIEPLVAAFTAPTPKRSSNIPNEDSLDFEFDDTNLFRANRYTGVDRLEGGTRITYGLKTGVYGFGGGSSTLFIGQSYRTRAESDFATGSGLETQKSDYVGRIMVDPAPWLYGDYVFRLDEKSLQPRKHDVVLSIGEKPLRFTTNYIFIDSSTGIVGGRSREEISAALTGHITDNWYMTAAQSRSFRPETLPLLTSLTLGYTDECLIFSFTAERNHTVRNDLQTGDMFYLRLLFKNLGGIDTPYGAGDVFVKDRNAVR